MIGLVVDLLYAAGVTQPPIRLPVITGYLGLCLRAHVTLPSDWDALLVRGKHKSVCYYNPNFSQMRVRWSIAHEIGHFLLHHGKGHIMEPDAVKWLDPEEECRIEREANDFAAELLMPTVWMLDACLHSLSFDDLRDYFWVSRPAMKRRLQDLGLSAPTKYALPTFTQWNTLDRDYALALYAQFDDFHPTLFHDSVTGDPYEDYLMMRGVHDPRQGWASRVVDVATSLVPPSNVAASLRFSLV